MNSAFLAYLLSDLAGGVTGEVITVPIPG